MNTLYSFPFKQIGTVLRMLSLSGSIGNVLSILLYIFICGSPIIYFFVRKKKSKVCTIDFLLFLISLSLFGGIYLYINPGFINQFDHFSYFTEQLLFISGMTIWSIIICYLLFRILHEVENGKTPELLCMIRHIIAVIIIFTVWDIAVNDIFMLVDIIQKTANNNTYFTLLDKLGAYHFGDNPLYPTYIWLFVQYAINCVPSILLLCVLLKARRSLCLLEKDSYDESAIQLLRKIGVSCKKIIITVGVLAVVQNIMQLLFLPYLYTTNYVLYFPIYTVLFTFVILLLSNKFVENRDLKLDNDSFI